MERRRTIILFSALGLCLFSLLTMGLVFIFYYGTEDRIQESRELHQKQILYDLIDGNIAKGQVEFAPIEESPLTKELGIKGFRILQANILNTQDTKNTKNIRGGEEKKEQKKQKELKGSILKASSKNGYSGSIYLLLAVDNKGELMAVRVSEHSETPGLGDKIERSKSSWIEQFNSKSLGSSIWAVSKDGGDFEALSGATISSRAVIEAVEEALIKWNKMEK